MSVFCDALIFLILDDAVAYLDFSLNSPLAYWPHHKMPRNLSGNTSIVIFRKPTRHHLHAEFLKDFARDGFQSASRRRLAGEAVNACFNEHSLADPHQPPLLNKV